MKKLLSTLVLSALALTLSPATADADTVEIDSNTYAAIAFSQKTGKYGYAWNYRSRAAAQREALARCPGADAEVVAWVNFGWAVLVIGEDGASGYATAYGEGATSGDAYRNALGEMRKHSDARVKTVLIVCSGDVRPKVIDN
jgi:hypothetical protein